MAQPPVSPNRVVTALGLNWFIWSHVLTSTAPWKVFVAPFNQHNMIASVCFHGDQSVTCGLTSAVRFTAGRRRYTVQFTTMVQVNEETGNRRPIMLSLPPREDDSAKKGKSDATATTGGQGSLQAVLEEKDGEKKGETNKGELCRYDQEVVSLVNR